MSGNKSYLDKPQDTGFKRIITNSFKKFKGFKEDTNKQLDGLEEKEFKKNQYLSDAQESRNLRLMETIRDLKMDSDKEKYWRKLKIK